MRTRFVVMLAVMVIGDLACGSGGELSDGGTGGTTADGSPEGGGSSGGSTGSSGASSSGASSSGTSSSGASSGATTSGASSGVTTSGASSGASDGGPCEDTCPAPNGGVTFGCEKRFLYGVNYAWKNWVADFGGVTAWGQKGVSQNQATIQSDLTDMQTHGVDVIRWWMLQQLEGDAVVFDSNGSPTGVGGTLVADIQAALDLAAQVGVHYNFTLFSFDDFKPNGTSNGATLHGMTPIATDAAKRAALMNVVKTVAQTVESSAHRDRVVSWDVINEPEWVIAAGSDPYGDPAFSPNTGYQPVTFAQMETFVTDTVKTLHQNSSAPVTVGGAAIKWAKAWSNVGLDFYTFHMYDWVNQYYPYDKSLASYGVTDKPVVLGEFPLAGLAAVNGHPAVPLGTMLSTLFTLGYAGAMPWAVDDTCCGSWSTAKTDVKTFGDGKPCVTRY
jgi:hypothetical protein